MTSGIFIQVGAGAGDLDERANCRDGFTELVKRLPRERIKKIILVEPNPMNIPKLRECWKDYPESEIHEIGIVPDECETLEFYYCPADAPHYQVASINKAHIEKHYGHGCELKKFDIQVKTLSAFIKECTDDEIELLALDIEGIDAEVLLSTQFKDFKVKYLSFEYIHLGPHAQRVAQHMEANHFTFMGPGVDHNGFDHLYMAKTERRPPETEPELLYHSRPS